MMYSNMHLQFLIVISFKDYVKESWSIGASYSNLFDMIIAAGRGGWLSPDLTLPFQTLPTPAPVVPPGWGTQAAGGGTGRSGSRQAHVCQRDDAHL